MSLSSLRRDIIWDEHVNIEIVRAYATVQHLVTLKIFQLYKKSIDDYLTDAAHECTQVSGGSNPLYKYPAKKLEGFGSLTVYFTTGDDDDGGWVHIIDFELS